MNQALEISGLVKTYKDFRLEISDLKLPSGCIMGLIGENGAGKTTTLKSILGLVHPDQGSLRMLGTDDAGQNAALHEHLGVVLDDGGFPENLTPKDTGRILSKIYRTWDQHRYEEFLKKFDIPLRKPLKDFSRGMRMKHAIAAALSHDCHLLILDEATSGLDPIAREELLDLLLEFIQDENHSVLISSHILSDLEKICDYIAFIHKGRILLNEEKDLLLDRFCMVRCPEEVFLSLPREKVRGCRKNQFGVEALVLRDALRGHPELEAQPASLEEIMLYHVKEVS
jgi:ABC-2 type transport system ATP-binding protein